MNISKSIFKAYDIRGIVEKDLTSEVVFFVGKVFGKKMTKMGLKKCIIGRDARDSGLLLREALVEGLQSNNIKIIDLGVVPTPIVYFATHYFNTGTGIVITGSHNPPQYNGLKMMLNDEPFWGEQIKELFKQVVSLSKSETKNKNFRNSYVENFILDSVYISEVCKKIRISRPLRVVVDAGNGVAGKVACELYKKMGCDVTEMYCEPLGSFPNHHPDPADPANLIELIEMVKENNFDVGLAFDGDGDRLGVVTGSGKIIWPDRQLMLFAAEILTNKPKSTVIFDVKCSRKLSEWIIKHNGVPLMWKTGHSLMKAKLKETRAAIAGEMSGHFFFNDDWFGFDDAIYAGARLLRILSKEKNITSTLEELPNSISTPEIKLETGNMEPLEIINQLMNVNCFPNANEKIFVDGVRAEYTGGFGLVRASNTTPILVLRFEGDTHEIIKKIKDEFRLEIKKIKNDLIFNF